MFNGNSTGTGGSPKWYSTSTNGNDTWYDFSGVFMNEMTDKDILIKAMAIAVRRGFDLGEQFFTETPTEFYLLQDMDLYFSLVFDHGFAKAFWGEDIHENMLEANWEYHIKEMVLSENPLKYLIPFLRDEE
jgi:hypothetical protein